MKEYDLTVPTPSGIRRIYHADAYRMERAEDFEKIGFFEWCADPEGLVLLEWPERIESLLPRHRTEIKLYIGEENLESRKISIRVL
jgi:tRNA threonylcarbamoyladenosine biosynthesis protein TsaE